MRPYNTDDQLSWLQSSIGDSNEPVLRAQLEYLQDELKNANDQLDNNFSRLESAGFGALSLAEKLAKANERISDLEDELRGLSQRNKASMALVTAQRDEDK
jgi:chromosome segregation ATPase